MAGQRHAGLFRRGRIYYVSFYRDGVPKQRSTYTDNPKKAEEIRRRYEREMFDGTEGLERDVVKALRDPAKRQAILDAMQTGQTVALDQALVEYEDYSRTYKRPKTIYNDLRQLRRTFASLSLTNIHDVTSLHLNTYVAMRVKGPKAASQTEESRKHLRAWGPASVLRWRECAHAFFAWCKRSGYIHLNPVDKVPRPRVVQDPIVHLRLEEIPEALDVFKGTRIESLVATAIYAGLRRGELTWLTPSDVDLDRKLLHVRAKVIDEERWDPKNRKNRVVPISTDLLPYLRRQRLRVGSSEWFFPSPEACRWDGDNLYDYLKDVVRKSDRRRALLERLTFEVPQFS